MSNSNYMDKVPVKISESYKPPPRVYQVSQAVASKLTLPAEHYHQALQYSYDFDLERKVLAKIPEWRRLREAEREARHERKEKREQVKLRAVEAKHKQMLGAVNYPSTEDLSSSDDAENEAGLKSKEIEIVSEKQHEQPLPEQTIVTTHTAPSSFNNILQPTILSSSDVVGMGGVIDNVTTNKLLMYAAGKFNSNVFNYKDFEEDTSSPFDNIELKTINDLDILAQVLHNTQLKKEQQLKEQQENDNRKKMEEENVQETKDNTRESDESIETVNNVANAAKETDLMENNSNSIANLQNLQSDVNLEIIENTKAALEKVDFSDLSQQLQNENIPSNNATSMIMTATANTTTDQQTISNNYNIYNNSTTSSYMPFSNQQHQQQQQQQQQRQQFTYMPYNQLYNGVMDQHQQQQPQPFTNYNLHAYSSNQNYLYAPNCNEVNTATTDATITAAATPNSIYFSPTHTQATHFISHNANNYGGTNLTSNTAPCNSPQQFLTSPHTQQLAESELSLRSKSVPDILKELSDELRNSEMRRRRSRNYSCNQDDNKEVVDDDKPKSCSSQQQTPTATKVSTRKHEPNKHYYYAKLGASAQKLTKKISSMGFPLERVAKIAQMFGADDKKIIEHLIPLTELMDLGFDETKISEALMKFDNNKEKALEYLIS